MNSPASPNSAMQGKGPPEPKRASRVPRRLLTVACLVGAAALAVLAVRSIRNAQSVHERVALVALDDPKELTARQRDVVGTYATGSATGDRRISVHADGTIAFAELGASPATGAFEDTWQLMRREKRFALSTKRSGVVSIVNIDTLQYYGDTYRRTP